MARYSSRTSSFLPPPYDNIPEEYHEEAARYIDNKYLETQGLDPDTHWNTAGGGTGDYIIPSALKEIAKWYVRERYSADSISTETDVWVTRKDENHYRRVELEDNFNPNIQLWQTSQVNADTGDGSSMTSRFRRG